MSAPEQIEFEQSFAQDLIKSSKVHLNLGQMS